MNDWLPDDESYRHTGDPISPEEIAFDTYGHYLNHITSHITDIYPTLDNYILHIHESLQALRLNRPSGISVVKKPLFIGWNTEYLVRINDNFTEIDFMRINNQWKPIQVYYSVYSLAAATCFILRNTEVRSHSTCLNIISEFLINAQLDPWDLNFTGYNGNSRVPSTITPRNFPQDLIIPNSLRRRDVTHLGVIACCLQAEHRNRIEEYRRGRNGVYKYMYEPTPTTFFHILYRLRKKSNYENAEVFLTNAPEEDIRNFSANLTKINLYTNVLMEIIIAKRIGTQNLLSFMEEFHRIHPQENVINIRLQMYRNLL